ncbi:MAG: GNAT family N-acetyltransferase, partial [Abditibacteriales bacterium]|nr:GNAT family N-acetyltransferase [Abditibacteriales bacterium]MDW8365759.1 GNAT family N-acetyltransferase [Abditibacteriales bacterium]
GENFPMTERLMRQNLEGDFMLRPEGSWVARDGACVVGWVLSKAMVDPPPILERFRGRGGIGALCVHPHYRRRGIGSELLRRAEEYLRSQGLMKVETLYFPYHFLPGVPVECSDLIEFLKKRGYVGGTACVDLERDITDFEMPPSVVERWQRDAPRAVIRPLRDNEVQALIAFVAREFPGGWHFSTQRHFASGGDPEDFVVVVEDDEIIGFCHTFTQDSVYLGGSTLWYPLLGENYGGLGPIGIAAAHRQRGLGLALLCESVMHNKRRGVRRMAIDWTGLIEFYERIGFKVWKRYWQASKNVG